MAPIPNSVSEDGGYSRRAGLVEPPPILVAEISAWVRELVAARLLQSKDWVPGLADLVRPLAGSNPQHTPDRVSRTFRVRLDGWKYLRDFGRFRDRFVGEVEAALSEGRLPHHTGIVLGRLSGKAGDDRVRDPDEARRIIRGIQAADAARLAEALVAPWGVQVTVDLSDDGGAALGEYRSKGQSIDIYPFREEPDWEVVPNPRLPLTKFMGDVDAAVGHELTHLTQDLLAELHAVQGTGMPGPRMRGDPASDPSGRSVPHALRDVEFYTRLRDEVLEFQRKGRWSNAARRLWLQRPFFQALKDHAPAKYQKAVSEFVRATEPTSSEVRVASRYLEAKYDPYAPKSSEDVLHTPCGCGRNSPRGSRRRAPSSPSCDPTMKIIATRPIPVDKDAIRKVVSAIVRELPSHLRFRPDDMDNPLWMARGFQKDRWGFYPNVPDVLITRPWLDEPIGLPEGSWPDTVDVRGVGVSAMLRLTAKSDPRATPDGPRYYVFGGHVKGNVGTPTNPKRYVEPDNVEVFINSSRTPNELLGNLDKVGRELYSVLIHEATHVRDLVRTKPAQYGVDPKAYYNEPSEVRAFMQQVADEVIEAIGAPELATGFMVTKAIQHSKTWNRIEPHLNASNRRLLLRGIGTAVMDARIVNRVASAWLHDARRLTGVR